jgi:hypothetical protein
MEEIMMVGSANPLHWHDIAKEGPPTPDRQVLLCNVERHHRYDVGCWRTEFNEGGYWATRGEIRAVRLHTFTHWAYFEGPSS